MLKCVYYIVTKLSDIFKIEMLECATSALWRGCLRVIRGIIFYTVSFTRVEDRVQNEDALFENELTQAFVFPLAELFLVVFSLAVYELENTILFC